MRFFEFFILFNANMALYFCSLFIVSIPVFYLAKRYTRTWIDPLRILMIFVSFANAVPLFLFFLDEIPSYLYYNFICSETLFWFGFVSFAKKNIFLSTKKITNENGIGSLLYITFYALYLSFTIFSYLNFGIPVFAESRLTTLEGSGGFGVLSRLNSFFVIFLLMYSYYLFDHGKSFLYRFTPYLVVVTIAITAIFSGSRSGFFIFVFTYFGYQYFYKGFLPDVKRVIKFIPIIISSGVVVMLITGSGSIQSAFIGLGQRFISTGDVYWMAYPNEVITTINLENSFSYLFSGILGPLRLIDNNNIPAPVGAQLTWALNPNLQGIMVGPNGRPPVLGYVLFGWWGLLYSFILGLFISFFLFKLPAIIPKGTISSAFIVYVYLKLQTFIVDPPLGMTYLFDIFLNLFFLIFLIIIFSFLIDAKNIFHNKPIARIRR
jgi:hypothetical protein